MSSNHSIQEIVRHYTDVDESSRLRTAWFQLEHTRTQALILRHLPPPQPQSLPPAEAQASSLWRNPKQRERLLDAVSNVESEQAVRRASSHIMAIARK